MLRRHPIHACALGQTVVVASHRSAGLTFRRQVPEEAFPHAVSVRKAEFLYVLLRASLHFPFFQNMYVPQLPAFLLFA